MPKKPKDPIEQIHKLCRDNRIVPLLITDEDFTEYFSPLTEKQLDELKHAMYDVLLEDYGEKADQLLYNLGYRHDEEGFPTYPEVDSDH